MTMLELLIVMLLVVIIFIVAYQVMDQARRETRKGFWVQKAVTELRNGTRAVSLFLKKTSYPTTIVKGGAQQLVLSYKEQRTYDDSGRLRNLTVKNSRDMDLTVRQGAVKASTETVRLMAFPMCLPETDLAAYQPGMITWVEMTLEPDPKQAINRLSRLVLSERDEIYDTRSLRDRAYGLTRKFDPSLTVAARKVLVCDVENILIDLFSTDELAGVHVTDGGSVNTTMKKKYLVSMRIECMNPADKNMMIGDQCSVTINIDADKIPQGL